MPDLPVRDEAGRNGRVADGGRPLRVWIFNHYATTPDRAGGTRHHALARQLEARGAEVTIFAAGFNHGTNREERISGRCLVRRQRVEGVRFVWLRTLPYVGNTWRRMVNMVSYAVIAPLAQIGRPAPDVVIGSTVHPFAALAAWLIARIRRARFIYEIRDLWPQTLIDLGALRADSLGARTLAAIEAFLVRRSTAVIALLPGVSTYLEQRGLSSAHVHYLPNGVDVSAFGRAPLSGAPAQVTALREQLARRRARRELVLAYVGAHGRVNGLDVVLRAFRIATDTSPDALSLVLVGDGPEKPQLMRLAAELQLTNVIFAEAIPRAHVPGLLAEVDVGVVHAVATPVYRFGISFNKVFDYMAAGLPIAFACTAEGDPVRLSNAGCSVVPDDPRALADAFVTLAHAPGHERRRMGQAGRSFVTREHDIGVLGERLARIVGAPSAEVRG